MVKRPEAAGAGASPREEIEARTQHNMVIDSQTRNLILSIISSFLIRCLFEKCK
jgi:hypothetical protein